METVEPIRNKTQIENMKLHLKDTNLRGWLMFILGINSGLRISDILSLTVEDVKGKDRLSIREQKTDKMKDFPFSDKTKKAISDYLKNTGISTGYLFPSRKKMDGQIQPIKRRQAYEILTTAAKKSGIVTKSNGIKIGTHSLRKTFGYHAYTNGYSLEKIMELLNHSSQKITLKYIGITKDQLDEIYINLDL